MVNTSTYGTSDILVTEIKSHTVHPNHQKAKKLSDALSKFSVTPHLN